MISKEVKVKINRWINDVVRIQIARPNKSEYLRLDCAERMYNYEDEFFNEFMSTLTQEDFITYPSYKESSLRDPQSRVYMMLPFFNITIKDSNPLAAFEGQTEKKLGELWEVDGEVHYRKEVK